jgi:hypothetical protein
MNAPPDDREPVPVTAAELASVKAAKDTAERLRIARLLLMISLNRLRDGRKLEREHGHIIHDAVSIIARDVLRLSAIVFPGGAASVKAADLEGVGDAEAEQPEPSGLRWGRKGRKR